MKVLFVHELFPPDVAGGGELIVAEFSKRLSAKGIEIEVVTTGNPKTTSFDGIQTHRIPINRYLMNAAFPIIAKRAKDFDLIQSFSFNASLPSYIAGKLKHKPIVNFVLGVYGQQWLDIKGPVLGRIFALLERMQLVHDFDKSLFLSEFSRRIGIKIGIKRESTDVVYPGVDAKIFRPGEKEGFVLFVGRLSRQKGLDYLLTAAKALPHVKFVIVGDGEEATRLRKIAPLNVEFKGWLKPMSSELVELYSKASIFCLPSIGEGFGIVLLEAMASGCAIVSTLPLDYEGTKVPPKDPIALRDAIRSLIDSPDRIEAMGKKNVKLSKKYDWETSSEKLKRLYTALI